MSRDERISREEAQRDLSAARAEVRGRTEQAVADCDERMRLLESLAQSLEAGDLAPKIVQDRVRQLFGERATVSRGARAGRTSIGLQLPRTAAATPSVPVRSGPTPTEAAACLARAMAAVDARIVYIMLSGPDEYDGAQLELALLRGWHRALEEHVTPLPDDVVLLESVVEFAERVESTIDDLETGGVDRLRRWLEYNRELASCLVALGGSVADLKDQLKRARTLLGNADADLTQAMQDALSAFNRLHHEIERRSPPQSRTFFDDVLSVRTRP